MMRVISTNVKYLILLGWCGLFWAGCNVINPVESTPTYIHIDSFKFEDNPNMGIRPATLSHDITTVWAYYNGILIGEFDLPCTFPVIYTSGARLDLYPGITVNGRNNTVDIYPFYLPDTTFKLVKNPGAVVSYTPKTRFFSTAKPSFKADFEQGTVLAFGKADGSVGMTQVHIPEDSLVFEGFGSGSIYMTSPGDSSSDSTTTFEIPTGNAFIEFNYKSDVQFYVGMQSNLSYSISSTPYYLYGIQPSATWKKFYLNVKAFVLNYKGSNYNFYIKTVLPDGQSTGRVLIDNVQLVTF